jgi:hypothetical protein
VTSSLSRRALRGTSRLCWLVLPLLAASRSAQADSSGLSARLECARATAPGRIVCELTASASSGKLVWVDALVVQAPPFARPLRSRFVAQTEPAGALGTASAKLALVASELGIGELELRVRAVLCHEGPNGEWCGPQIVPVSGVVEVGPAAPVAR